MSRREGKSGGKMECDGSDGYIEGSSMYDGLGALAFKCVSGRTVYDR